MSTTYALHPELREHRRAHEQIRYDVESLLDGMTPEQFNFRPAPGRWSIGQNLVHLNLAAAEHVAIVRRLVDRGRDQEIRGDGPFRYSRWGNWYIGFTAPPYRTRIRTLKRYTAPPVLDIDAVAARFMALKWELLRAIDDASGLDLERLRAPLPYLPLWNPSLALGQWFPYIAAHERRHLWQIAHVRQSPGYPTARYAHTG